jgi:hypothetical protein
MALIPCSECGKEISTDSIACPHCGKPKPGKPKTGKKGKYGCLTLFLFFMAFSMVVNVIRSVVEKPEMSEAEKRLKVRESLEPPTKVPLTPRQHLEAAKRLLAQIDVNDYSKAEALIELTSEHGTQARNDPQTRAQADLVMKRMANKSLEVVKIKAWNASGTDIAAELACKHYIASTLKAPSTADWLNADTGRWRDHPGYFLVTHTVDAENSFGAKLRANYQCQVLCLSQTACHVEKMNQVER